MRKEHDWKKYQEYYDLGNSWKKVTECFGVCNGTLQKAIKRGSLITRTRNESISITLLEKRGPKSVKNCKSCGVILTSSGKYCSMSCSTADIWEEKHLPRILDGLAARKSLRNYLINRDKKCSKCGLGQEWYGEPISLQMDHIDGDSSNNDLTNVRLLCPNCHSQTPTFGRKNKGKKSKRNEYRRIYYANNKEIIPAPVTSSVS